MMPCFLQLTIFVQQDFEVLREICQAEEILAAIAVEIDELDQAVAPLVGG